MVSESADSAQTGAARSRGQIRGKARQVIFHRPSHAWVKGLDVLSQPGVSEHFGYLMKLFESNRAVAAGPFTDASSGGMLILHENVTEADALAIARDDPGVRSGLIDFQIRTWLVTLDAGALAGGSKAPHARHASVPRSSDILPT
jgi:uncharacterized protein YciI